MARVVVVGGGFAGAASAARLAKLGHEVVLLERAERLGGALERVELDGFAWDGGPAAVTMPAVVRDLWRKSGRPLEREVDLVAQEVVAEHRFEDRTTLLHRGGSRAAQIEALDGLRPGLGQQWVDHVQSFAEVWEALRRDLYERPFSPDLASRTTLDALRSRRTLHKELKRAFRDRRLQQLAAYPFVLAGHDPRGVPAWAGLHAYLEQRFGTWTVPQEVGGLSHLADALAERLATRRVEVRTGTTARDLVLRGGRVVAVRTDAGEVDADAVVVAVDPRRLPALRDHVAATMPAIPPVVAHLGLHAEDGAALPDLGADEVVLHGDPLLVVRRAGTAPADLPGAQAWTVLARGKIAEDLVLALARRGLKVRQHVVARVDRSPRELVEHWGGSPLGVRWQGRATTGRLLGPRTPVPGVYAAGAHTTTGLGLPFSGLSAALVADAVGPA